VTDTKTYGLGSITLDPHSRLDNHETRIATLEEQQIDSAEKWAKHEQGERTMTNVLGCMLEVLIDLRDYIKEHSK
jgi:hypothetical protein